MYSPTGENVEVLFTTECRGGWLKIGPKYGRVQEILKSKGILPLFWGVGAVQVDAREL